MIKKIIQLGSFNIYKVNILHTKMQNVDSDLFSIVAAYLSDKFINSLALSTMPLSNIISIVRKNDLFWSLLVHDRLG